MATSQAEVESLVASRLTVEADSSCWVYGGHINASGYGVLRFAGRAQLVHRLMYEARVGPVAADRQIDHLCRNRACCNPDHLEPVTLAENVLRGEGITAVNKRKTHCIHGHEFTPANTISRERGWRACRTCHTERLRRARTRKREAA